VRTHITDVAKRDIVEISDYYTEIFPDLADRFADEIDSSFKQLRDRPEIGSPRFSYLLPDHSLRIWQFDRFPFLVLYRLQNDLVDLLRVLHERRDLSADLINK
jgi:toxin ParE1/3/4